jgi:hypothetical protein
MDNRNKRIMIWNFFITHAPVSSPLCDRLF